MQVNRDYVARENVDLYNTVVMPNRRRHISWGAIFAGAVIALITLFGLSMLGLSIGAATINPAREIDPVEPALGVGTVIWFAASTLIAMFLGGYTAGRMAAMRDEGDGILHGLVTWALVTGITLFMLTTSIGGLISGVTNAFATTVSNAGQAIGDIAPEVAQALNLQDETLMSIQGEAREFFNLTDPQAEDGEGQTVTQSNAPLTLDQLELNREIRAFLALNPDDITDSDRDSLAAAIAERTELSQQEARAQVNRWEAVYVDIRTEAETLARDVSQGITDAITLLAGAIFASMIVGAFAAGAGAYVGTEVHEEAEVVDVAEVRRPVAETPHRPLQGV